MRKSAIVLFVILLAAAAQAGIISDIQQGLVPEDTMVQIGNATVTGAAYNGCFITELPVGPYSGIWVYLGEDHTVVDGDIINVVGQYVEYYGLSEINVGGIPDGVYEVVGGGELPTPFFLTAAELYVDPEVFESVAICITDGMMVQDVPSSYGEWYADVLDSDLVIMFDDFWYDASTVMAGHCYNHACGVLTYSYSNYKLEAYADGIEVVDCTVGTEASTLTEIKGIFR